MNPKWEAIARGPRLDTESRNPARSNVKAHLRDPRAASKVSPFCGGRNGGRSILEWQVVFGGLEAVNCEACIEIASKHIPEVKELWGHD